MNEEPPASSNSKRPRRGPDPRLLGLLAIVLAVALALVLAHVVGAVNHADRCLAAAGRNC